MSILNPSLKSKVFNDSVHGHIKLHPLLVKFIDTPEFQRLRFIKQLGCSYWIYPGACHNRFEHSIGTCHLANKLLQSLREHNESVCDDRDHLCVLISGLCHDLGHGAFSHVFDGELIPMFCPERNWTHEEGSCSLLDQLIESNDLKDEFAKYGLNFDEDLPFIKELINPPQLTEGVQYKYRPKEKNFLYEIISNKSNGVDVDKWDYLARDCHHLGLINSFDHNRVISNMKVVRVDNTTHIAIRDKDSESLYEMYHMRSKLHRVAYQHRIAKAIETMICDALKLASPYLFYLGKNNKMFKLHESIDDMVAYSKITDNILNDISNSPETDEDMMKAKKLVERIHKRNLYVSCGRTSAISTNDFKTMKHRTEEIAKEIISKSDGLLKVGDIFVKVITINYGDQEHNPLERFLFYSKDAEGSFVMRSNHISTMLPRNFQDYYIQVFCRNKSHKEITRNSFTKWCTHKNFSCNRINIADGMTPQKLRQANPERTFKKSRRNLQQNYAFN